jgi:hypothetical protein
MIDDRAKVTQLLQVQGGLGIDWTPAEGQII